MREPKDRPVEEGTPYLMVTKDADVCFQQGTVLVMDHDDGSTCPSFHGTTNSGRKTSRYVYWKHLEPIPEDLL